MLATAALIGLLSQPAVLTCDEMKLVVARAGRSIFLDPTPKNRAKATQDALRILPPPSCDFLLEHLEYDDEFDWSCLCTALWYLDERGDSALLWDGRKSLANSYSGCTLEDEQRRREGIVNGLRGIEPPNYGPANSLAYHPDPDVRAALWRAGPTESPELVEMAELLDESRETLLMALGRSPDRPARLALVLGSSSRQAETAIIWAVDELTADPDPRKWAPEDVALLLWHARACLGKPRSALCKDDPPPTTGWRLHRSYSGRPFRNIFIRALMRMGLTRSLELMNANGRANIAMSDLGRLPNHIPYQKELCLSEGHEKCYDWMLALDQRAPVPSLERVRKALRTLDESGSKPR